VTLYDCSSEGPQQQLRELSILTRHTEEVSGATNLWCYLLLKRLYSNNLSSLEHIVFEFAVSP
jgi:hypothetical protein